jgi:hypothetical protein
MTFIYTKRETDSEAASTEEPAMGSPVDASSPGTPLANDPAIGTATEPDSPKAGESDGSAQGRLVALTLAAGVVAGIAAWLAGEVTLKAFVPPSHNVNMMGQNFEKVEFLDQSAADFKNAMVAFGWLGCLLAAAMGLAGGLARDSRPAGLRAAAIGLLLGLVLALVASLAFLPIYFHALDRSKEELSRDLMIPLLTHAGIWAACGLAGGIALGIGMGDGWPGIAKAALGGLIGAAIGAAAYEMIGAFAFGSRDHTTSPVSWSLPTRLLARLLVATLAAAFAAIAVNTSGRRPAGPRTAS